MKPTPLEMQIVADAIEAYLDTHTPTDTDCIDNYTGGTAHAEWDIDCHSAYFGATEYVISARVERYYHTSPETYLSPAETSTELTSIAYLDVERLEGDGDVVTLEIDSHAEIEAIERLINRRPATRPTTRHRAA